MATFKIRRGLEAGRPDLAVGEPGFCTDTGHLYVGSTSGDVGINAHYITPEAYGASGGVADDSIPFQNMINSLVDNTPQKIVCAGSYRIANVVIPVNKQEIHFAGKNSAIVGGGASEIRGVFANSILFSVANGLYNLRFSDILLSNCGTVVEIPPGSIINTLSFNNVGIQEISDRAIFSRGGAGFGIISLQLSEVNFYHCLYGIYSTYLDYLNNLHCTKCSWANPIDGGWQVYVGGLNGDGSNTNLTFKDCLMNGTPVSTSIPFFFGGYLGTVVLDGVHFADYVLTPATNAGFELITLGGDGAGNGVRSLSIVNCDAVNERSHFINITATTIGRLRLENNIIRTSTPGSRIVELFNRIDRPVSINNTYAADTVLAANAAFVSIGDSDLTGFSIPAVSQVPIAGQGIVRATGGAAHLQAYSDSNNYIDVSLTGGVGSVLSVIGGGYGQTDINVNGGIVRLGNGQVRIRALASFANNAAAVLGGLVSGDLYCETGTDPLRIARVI